MKASILYLSLALFARSGLASAQDASPPADQQVPCDAPGSGTKHPNGCPTEAQIKAAYEKLNARPVPAHVLYFFLFDDLIAADQVAASQEAKGKGPGSYRIAASRAAGLTDDEGATLNDIARDWKQQQDAIDARRQAILDARRAEPNPPKNLLTMEEFSQFGKEEIANIDEHAEQLKSQLGDASFAKLDTYLKAHYHPAAANPWEHSRPPTSVVPPSTGSAQ